jgi:hypothetical protein
MPFSGWLSEALASWLYECTEYYICPDVYGQRITSSLSGDHYPRFACDLVGHMDSTRESNSWSYVPKPRFGDGFRSQVLLWSEDRERENYSHEGCVASATYSRWIPHPEGLMKLNADAAVRNHRVSFHSHLQGSTRRLLGFVYISEK